MALGGIKIQLCQLCVGRVCLLKPRMILGKNGTGNNGTNGEVGKTGTLMLNFPKPPLLT